MTCERLGEKILFGTGINPEGFIDLRSDVVTKPSKGMLKMMMEAKVGNDGWQEDPTVQTLQKNVAKMLGKEAALIIPSGTMANQIAIRLLAPGGTEAIVERYSHIYNYETAGAAVLSGVQLSPVVGVDGILSWEDIQKNIRPLYQQFPKTSLICLENTHNNGGGKIYPLDLIEAISENARKRSIKMHLDGARIFNACVETGISPRRYAEHFDTILICLSKSLGCPGGSLLVGSKEITDEAFTVRRQFGGGMRQIAGYMAAAGLYAIEHNIKRLKEDHIHARAIAKAISECEALELLKEPETNIILFAPKDKRTPEEIVNHFKGKGILIAPYNYPILRAVTHLDISEEDTKKGIEVIQEMK